MTLPAPLVASRKVVREKIAALLTTGLVGPTLPVQLVYDYQVEGFGDDNDVTVIVVTSAGSDRTTARGRFTPIDLVYIDIHLFVLYSKEAEWTEEQSEDALDLIEQGVVSILKQYVDRSSELNPEWLTLVIKEASGIEPVIVGGKSYRHEVVQTELEVVNVS